jgi:hypothetical protein
MQKVTKLISVYKKALLIETEKNKEIWFDVPETTIFEHTISIESINFILSAIESGNLFVQFANDSWYFCDNKSEKII